MDNYFKINAVIISVVLFIIISASSIRCVPVGHDGIVKKLGTVKHDQTLNEGWHFVIPFITNIIPLTKKLIKIGVEAESASKDLQNVKTIITVQYSLKQVSFLFQKIGDEFNINQIVLLPAVQESVKAVTAVYTAENLIKKRVNVKLEIENQIKEFVKTTLEKKSLSVESIVIANIALTDFQFSQEFNTAIEEKVKAEQDALRAKNEKMKKITEAQAIAETIRLESIARANAIKREALALKMNPLLIEYKKIEKWDGNLPKVTSGVIPLLDVNKSLNTD